MSQKSVGHDLRSEGKENLSVKLVYIFYGFEHTKSAFSQLQQSLNDYKCKFQIEPSMKKSAKDKTKVPKLNLANVNKPDQLQQPAQTELSNTTGGIDFLDGVKSMDAYKQIEAERQKEVLESLNIPNLDTYFYWVVYEETVPGLTLKVVA